VYRCDKLAYSKNVRCAATGVTVWNMRKDVLCRRSGLTTDFLIIDSDAKKVDLLCQKNVLKVNCNTKPAWKGEFQPC
jgi:fructose-1,6-bisphosphatase/sedoheptulose 1,7-bisphosphatase-like protein